MSLFHMFHQNVELVHVIEAIGRIVLAAFCGGVIGIERSRRFKSAGVRTHSVVACSAALLMIISKYGFLDLANMAGEQGLRGADPARIAAQVVSGISFLGVGIIYRNRQDTVLGLNTAAGIWTVAGIGLAIGAGMYYIGIFSTIFIMLLQVFMHRFVVGNDKYTSAKIEIAMEDDLEFGKQIQGELENKGALISATSVTRDDGQLRYEMNMKFPSQANFNEWTTKLMEDKRISSVNYKEYN